MRYTFNFRKFQIISQNIQFHVFKIKYFANPIFTEISKLPLTENPNFTELRCSVLRKKEKTSCFLWKAALSSAHNLLRMGRCRLSPYLLPLLSENKWYFFHASLSVRHWLKHKNKQLKLVTTGISQTCLFFH